MAGRNMNLDVIVRMRDLLTGPLRRLRSGLESLTSFARKIGLVGTAIAAISFMAPMKEAAAFQQQLIDIASTAGLSGDAAFKAVEVMKGQYQSLALEVGQSSKDVAKAAGQMIAAGVDQKLVDASIGQIGRAATAANADIADMAGVATSLLQNLKLPADQLNDALGSLVIAGKEGAFELKDMARFLPTLTGQMAKFGVTGREAVNYLGAALQVARKGTADPAEAANNLKNFLSKILAPQTIKTFAEAGVDLQAVMQDAATKGINPIEAVMQKVVKLTGVSSTEIEKLMKSAKANGLEGADALGFVREQLEAIHGAGALGELFSDMQVMDFLIPFLANVDEFKRIKEEVAKATGADINKDFETQMAGLNRQLIKFKELGEQVSDEIGLAFGTWMPMINTNLAAALKWMRELDASTGGMVKQGLAFAGVGVLIAAGLGVLGVVLPVIAAGFGALMALLSPVGLLLGAVALGANHIYKNWGSYGPRLVKLWDRAKYGFANFANIMMDRGRRIVAAGREMVDRYGPVVKAGFSKAWTDVKGGLNNLQSLFKGFAKGLDLDIDLSGLTIEDAKIAAFKALDVALAGIARGWQALKDFGSGFAPYLSSIGENVGGTVKAIGGIADGMWRLASALGRLVNFDPASASGIFKWIGGFAGGALDVATFAISQFAEALSTVINKIADVAEGKETWESLIPKGLSDAWSDASDGISKFVNAVKALPGDFAAAGVEAGQRMVDGIKSKFDELIAWFRDLPSRILSAIGNIDISSSINWPSWPTWLGGGGPPEAGGGSAMMPANNNMLPAQPSSQTTVGGSITLKAEPGTTVTNAETSNPAVPFKTNTGRAVGRP